MSAISQQIVPPSSRNNDHVADNILGTCLTTLLLFLMATAYGSFGFPLYCSHASVSPTNGVQVNMKTSDKRIRLVHCHISHVIQLELCHQIKFSPLVKFSLFAKFFRCQIFWLYSMPTSEIKSLNCTENKRMPPRIY